MMLQRLVSLHGLDRSTVVRDQRWKRGLRMNSQEAWIAVSQIPGLSPAKRLALCQYFGDARTAWLAGPEAWAEVCGVVKHLRRWQDHHQNFEAESLVERCRREGVEIITWPDASYPELLREIPQPPLVLYRQGDVWPMERFLLAVVGTRKPDSYGRRMTRMLVGVLSDAPVCLVSGLARGIDAEAHQVAWEHGIPSVAVLGNGTNVIYPSEHRHLYQAVSENGSLLSEYPPDTEPAAWHFPARNRIIAGMARALLVVQAPRKSGALITARHALEANRDVWSVPADATRQQSEGCLELIRDGAMMIRNPRDLFEGISSWLPQVRSVLDGDAAGGVPLTVEEAAVMHAVRKGASDFDSILQEVQLPVQVLNTTLLSLQLKGLIDASDGPFYHVKT